MPIISQIPDTRSVEDILDTHQKTVTLAVLMTKTILSDQKASLASTVSDGVLVKLYLDAAWMCVWCLSVLGCRNVNDTQVGGLMIFKILCDSD